MSKHQPIPEPTPVRSVVTVAIFLAGFIAAVVGYLQVQPTPRAGLPSAAPGFLATVEPAAAQAVVQDMIKGDAKDLATRVKSADLTDLQTAVKPLVDITSIDFVSASRWVTHSHDVLRTVSAANIPYRSGTWRMR